MAKKKINDDKLLQWIRDGNSPAEAARFFVGGKLRHQLQPPCQYEKSDVAGVGNERDTNMLIRVPAPSNVLNSSIPQFLNSSIPQSLNSSIPQFLNPSIHQFLNSSIPQFLNPSIPQSLNSSIPQFLNPSIPQSLNSSIPPSLNSSIPQFLNPS